MPFSGPKRQVAACFFWGYWIYQKIPGILSSGHDAACPTMTWTRIGRIPRPLRCFRPDLKRLLLSSLMLRCEILPIGRWFHRQPFCGSLRKKKPAKRVLCGQRKMVDDRELLDP